MRFSTRVLSYAVLAAFAVSQQSQGQEPKKEPAAKALLVLDTRLSEHKKLGDELDRYRKLVLREFGYDLVVVKERAEIKPADLRALLKEHRSKDKIRGAFLVGGFRLAKFKAACGDECAFPEYYQDFDGDIRDEAGKGTLDYYDPWKGRDKQEPLEIWLSVLRPYEENVAGEPGVEDLVRYFARVNDEMDKPAADDARRAVIFTSKSWDGLGYLEKALQPVFPKGVTLIDGKDKSGTSVDDFKRAVGISAELLFVFAHSGPSAHHLDKPAYPENLILPGELDLGGKVLLEDMQVNSRVLMLFACHGLDLEGITYKNGRFLANSYVLNPKNRTQTVFGAARSIGLEDLTFVVERLGKATLCEAWLDYQNHVYEAAWLRHWLGGSWEKEKLRFNWSYVMYGNPFARIARPPK